MDEDNKLPETTDDFDLDAELAKLSEALDGMNQDTTEDADSEVALDIADESTDDVVSDGSDLNALLGDLLASNSDETAPATAEAETDDSMNVDDMMAALGMATENTTEEPAAEATVMEETDTEEVASDTNTDDINIDDASLDDADLSDINMEDMNEDVNLDDMLGDLMGDASADATESMPIESETDDTPAELNLDAMLDGDSDENETAAESGELQLDDLSALLGDDDGELDLEKMLGGFADDDEISSGAFGEMDLDQQIEAMMNADKAADESFETRSIHDLNLVTKRSTYDGDALDGESSVRSPFSKKESRRGLVSGAISSAFLSGITVKRAVAYAAVFLLFMFGAAATFVLATRARLHIDDAAAEIAVFTGITTPANVANNTNFTFVREQGSIAADVFTLTKLSIGHTGTYFFFEEYFDPEQFIIALYDQNDNLFIRHSVAPDETGTILRFCSLEYDTKFLTLIIQNPATNERVVFRYQFYSPPIFGAPVFMNRPLALIDGAYPLGLRIEYGVFDNASSQIHYNFAIDEYRSGLRIRGDSLPQIIAREVVAGVQPMWSTPVYHSFEGMTMGVHTFSPVSSLNTRLEVTFLDLYYVHRDVYVDVPLREFFGRDQNNPHPLSAGAYTVNIEAMGQQGHLLIVVLHGVDPDGNRTEMRIDTSLTIQLEDSIITLQPEQMLTSPTGTDIVFNLRDYIEFLLDVSIDYYTFNIHSVEFDIPGLTIELDLSRSEILKSSRRVAAESAIIGAFLSRMAYLAGDTAFAGVVGFSPAMMAEGFAATPYAPQNEGERRLFGARIVSGTFKSNYDFLAVVETEWLVGEGATLRQVRGTHQVRALSENGVWFVVGDTVVSN